MAANVGLFRAYVPIDWRRSIENDRDLLGLRLLGSLPLIATSDTDLEWPDNLLIRRGRPCPVRLILTRSI